MRSEEINKWIEEGGSLPKDLTQEEKDHLMRLGWSVEEGWYYDGQKEFEHHYLHGKEHGKWKWWHSDGQKEYEYHYLHGKMHGKREAWYTNGQKWSKSNWLHGMKHGVFKSWDEDGSLYKDEEYFYGNRIK